MIRLYYNGNDPLLPVSADFGPGTHEFTATHVIVNSPCVSKFDVEKLGSKKEPCFWLEFSGQSRILVTHYAAGQYQDTQGVTSYPERTVIEIDDAHNRNSR